MINITFNGVGNLVTDPETITANNGQNVTSFRFACNGRDRTKTTFLKINAWNNIGATIEKYAKKGSRMYLGGDMTINEYKTSAGENRISMEVTVNRFEFISTGVHTAPVAEPIAVASTPALNTATKATAYTYDIPVEDAYEEVEDDDLPF